MFTSSSNAWSSANDPLRRAKSETTGQVKQQMLFQIIYKDLSGLMIEKPQISNGMLPRGYEELAQLSTRPFRELCEHLYNDWIRRKKGSDRDYDDEEGGASRERFDPTIKLLKAPSSFAFATLSGPDFKEVASAVVHELGRRYPELKTLEITPANVTLGSGDMGKSSSPAFPVPSGHRHSPKRSSLSHELELSTELNSTLALLPNDIEELSADDTPPSDLESEPTRNGSIRRLVVASPGAENADQHDTTGASDHIKRVEPNHNVSPSDLTTRFSAETYAFPRAPVTSVDGVHNGTTGDAVSGKVVEPSAYVPSTPADNFSTLASALKFPSSTRLVNLERGDYTAQVASQHGVYDRKAFDHMRVSNPTQSQPPGLDSANPTQFAETEDLSSGPQPHNETKDVSPNFLKIRPPKPDVGSDSQADRSRGEIDTDPNSFTGHLQPDYFDANQQESTQSELPAIEPDSEMNPTTLDSTPIQTDVLDTITPSHESSEGKSVPSDDWKHWWQANCSDVSKFLNVTARMHIPQKLECLRIGRTAKIYPRVFAYLFVHLNLRMAESCDLDALRQTHEELSGWDDLQCLLKQHTIRLTLWNLLNTRHNKPDVVLTGCDLACLLTLDMGDLRRIVERVLRNREQKEKFLELCTPDPSPVINLLQTFLDGQNLTDECKRLIVRSTARIAKKSGCYPDCLALKDVRPTGDGPIAGGGFADVWKGSMDSIAGQTDSVALKVFRVYKQSVKEKTLQRFSHEAVIWRQLKHPNILPFYGVFTGDKVFDRLCLVSPWMNAGNIMEYIDANPHVNRLHLLADVTQGLEYLHHFEPTVVHGDIKGANVFVTSSLTACLADFGLASLRDSQGSTWDTTTEKAAGTLRWQAPELLLGDENGETVLPNRCSDIYSFGCLCIEVFTGKAPFMEHLRDTVVMMSIMQKKIPERPADDHSDVGLDDSMWTTMRQCWQSDPTLRPTVGQLVDYFNCRKGADTRGLSITYDLPKGVQASLSQYGFPESSFSEISHRDSSEQHVQSLFDDAVAQPHGDTSSHSGRSFPVALEDMTTPDMHYKGKALRVNEIETQASQVKSYRDRVSLCFGDITRLKTDVIVNPINRIHGAGNLFEIGRKGTLDNIVHRAAGPGLLDECRTLGVCNTGEARITKGYNLPCKSIIHVVGPYYTPLFSDISAKELAACYLACFNLAVEKAYRSIAFPTISTGYKRYPVEAAANIALEATRDFLSSEQGASLDLVEFCLFEEEHRDVYRRLLSEYFP